MIKIIVFALLGKLTIYLAQNFPFISLPLIGRYWKEKRFLGKLFACDLCLGVWVYTIIAILLEVNLFEEFGYIPIVFEFFTGAAMSFIMHLLTIGWRDKFEVIHIGE
jgi:hypothetical protein